MVMVLVCMEGNDKGLMKDFTCLNNNIVFRFEACKKVFSGTPMADNMEDALVTRDEERHFVTTQSLELKTYA